MTAVYQIPKVSGGRGGRSGDIAKQHVDYLLGFAGSIEVTRSRQNQHGRREYDRVPEPLPLSLQEQSVCGLSVEHFVHLSAGTCLMFTEQWLGMV